MKERVIITDLTRMRRPRVCVAGYLPDCSCVRPVFRRRWPVENWLRCQGKVIIRPFAVVEFDFTDTDPQITPPHTEDRIVNPVYRLAVGTLTTEEQLSLLRRTAIRGVEDIFGAPVYRTSGGSAYVQMGEGVRSLGTIEPQEIRRISYTCR